MCRRICCWTASCRTSRASRAGSGHGWRDGAGGVADRRWYGGRTRAAARRSPGSDRSAEPARQLAAGAGTWHRVLTHPVTGWSSTTTEPSTPCPGTCVAWSGCATAPAASRDAGAGPKAAISTTGSPGPTAARRASTTWPHCAGTTTGASTATGTSDAGRCGGSRPVRSTGRPGHGPCTWRCWSGPHRVGSCTGSCPTPRSPGGSEHRDRSARVSRHPGAWD